MNPGALRALEFDRVVAALASFAITPVGEARLEMLAPESDPRRVAALQQDTAEAVRYLASQAPFDLRAGADLPAVLALLDVEGRPLEPQQLLSLAAFLESVGSAASAIRRAPGDFPRLRSIADRAAGFGAEIADVRHRITETAEVADHASPALASIRDRLRRQRSRLRATLEGFLRSKDTSKYLQDQIVTERNGRFVLPLRAEHRSGIAGIVHGSSASGATLFVEPLATVEISNEIAALDSEEREEVLRILLELTDRFRARIADVRANTAVAADLDVVQAKARLADVMGASAPLVAEDGRLELRGARHPLLMRGIVSRYSEQVEDLPEVPVPVDILVEPPTTALLITGPNTGGKTVALKTAGLLALMAQAGLHVPAEPGSSLPVFRSIFADIGDEQSIAASLSTFSWHMTNMAAMDRELQRPALVLLDEIGAGTDPTEGGALGIALVEHFRGRGALVLGTTHYDALKSYASTTPGVVCAAFGFNPDGFRPTYRLQYGTPGRSLALEIAARLGLPASIIESARQHVSARDAQLQDHLARVDADLSALERDRLALEKERQAFRVAEQALTRREQALVEREERLRRRITDRIDERVRDARREIDAVVQDLRKRTTVLADRVTRREQGPRLTTGDAGAARLQAQAALEEVAARVKRGVDAPGEAPAAPERPAQVGDRVAVGGFGLEGIVVSLGAGQAEVDVRGKRMRAPAAALRVMGAAPARVSTAPVRVNVNLQPRQGSLGELNVIGCTVDEALDRVERFLDETLITEQRTVRLVHGYGSGQLRRGIAELLKDHPLVASFRQAPPEQGGGGVTVVELKE